MRQRRSSRKVVSSALAPVFAEALEQRQMLSVTASTPNPSAHPLGGGFPAGSATAPGFSPTQIKEAYGISGISFNGLSGTGAGQTIAIIVAYDNPKLVSSTDSTFDSSDLHMFDVKLGLPDPPLFTKVDQTGLNAYPTSDPGWANEAALDVEWTHAIAPDANILLVEADSTNLTDLIQGAAAYAATVPGVSVVTMSFAVDEFFGESSYDSYLTTPSGHSGVTFLAASGDNGDVGGYPAYSPNVLAIGATTLSISGSNPYTYGSESGLNTSGGGISQYESKPSYQVAQTKSSTFRTIPDVAVNGDKNTGVSVYDSLNGGASTPWYKIGGTSASTPVWAGLIAIANQGRKHEGLTEMDGVQQTLPRLYSLNSSDYHDVTGGSNGLNAGTGYDLVTGLGTPIANKLVPDLAGGAKISGTVFSDTNNNGVKDSGEAGLSGYSVFLNVYNSSSPQSINPTTTSNSSGGFLLSDLPGGTFSFSQVSPAGVDLTTPVNQSVTLSYGTTVSGKNIGFKPTGAASQLVFAQQPTTVVVGQVIVPAITVNVEDASGGIVAGENSAVTLSVSSGGGSLGGSLTVNAINGVATFSNISITSVGTETLKATDGSLTSATSGSFAVQNVPPLIGDPSQLAFAQQPFSVTTGSVITPSITVQVQDNKGNLVNTDNSAVTLSIGTGPACATLGGTLTVNAVNGIAIFTDISASQAGTYTLTASDAAITPATSTSFAVTAIVYVPAKLVITQQPSVNYIGDPISPALSVNVEDVSGVLVTADSSAVSVAIASGPAGATLGGAVSVYAVNGVATFSNITVSTPGAYTLTISDGTLTPATTISFDSSIKGTLVPSVVQNSLPASVVGGAKIRGTLIVNETNLAVATATGLVTTSVYASQNGVQTLLGTVSKRMKASAKKTLLVSVPVKQIPASLNGTYTLLATVTDPTGHSNTSVVGTTLKVAPPYIALAPTITKLTLGPSVIGGSKTNAVAVVKVTNNGNIPTTGLTTVGVYASPDGKAADAIAIATVTRKLSIPVGRSVNVTVPLKQLPAALNGSYQMLSQVTDSTSAVTTSVAFSTVKFAPPYVAFAASGVTATPEVIASGKNVSMTVTIQNTGNVAATGSATIVLGISSDGIAMLSQLTTITRRESIAPGKQIVLHLMFKEFVALTPGNYYPFVTYTQDSVSTQAAGNTLITLS